MTRVPSWFQHLASLDLTRMGSRAYTAIQVKVVSAMISETSYDAPLTVADMARASGIPGRTIRAVISDLDGDEFLIGKRGEHGLFVCHWLEEAEAYSQYLTNHWMSERDRERRRQGYISQSGLRRKQDRLFDDFEPPLDSDDDD